MPFRENEEFLPCFLADTQSKADELLARYQRTISLLASKYASYTGLDEEDLSQEGIIGLARAARDFEEDRSDTFHTFAIYKIKDAMREFSSKQADNVKIPQYLQEASRLAIKLQKVMNLAGLVQGKDFMSVWEQSATCDKESEVIKDITAIRQTIKSLADRSGTSVNQLLERAELFPVEMTELDQHTVINELMSHNDYTSEESLLHKLSTKKSMERLREILTKEEYGLLYEHFIEGRTVRELAPILGITAPSVTIKIHNIISKLQKKEDQILML